MPITFHCAECDEPLITHTVGERVLVSPCPVCDERAQQEGRELGYEEALDDHNL